MAGEVSDGRGLAGRQMMSTVKIAEIVQTLNLYYLNVTQFIIADGFG